MTFEVRDYYDFVRLLYQHPEWQEELGNLLIAREIRELPQLVHELAEAQKRTEQRVEELAEAQKRTEERLTRLETVVAELAEAQKRTEQRVEELAEAQKRTEQRVEELAEAQKRTEERLTRLETVVAELAEAQKRTDEQLRLLTQRVDALTERVDKLAAAQEWLEKRVETLTTRVGEVSGYMLEGRYRQRPLAYFGRLLAQAQVVDVNEVIPAESNLTDDELQELLVLDLLIQGQLRTSFAESLGTPKVWLAVEVSGQIEYNDVERAWQRAELLKRCGLWPVVGVVGGKEITDNAKDAASRKKVLVELERRLVNLDEILAALKAGAGGGEASA